MKQPHTITLIAIGLAILFTASCGQNNHESTSSLMDSADNIKPLVQKSEHQPFCGVERYKSLSHKICGIGSYKAARTTHCGIESYFDKPNMACPGSYTADDIHISEYSTIAGSRYRAPGEPAPCPAGYGETDYKVSTRTRIVGGREGIERTEIVSRTRYCHRPVHAATCRHSSNGIERYKSCRHKNHGIESYNACRHSSFGVELYKSCKFYLTAPEINQYVQGHSQLVDFMGEEMLNQQGNFYAFSADEVGMACTIKNYETDVIYDSIIKQLKVIFAAKFGTEYKADSYDCATNKPEIDITSFTCPAEEADTRKCKSHNGYKAAKKWLAITRTDVLNLIGDIVAAKDAAIKSLLTTLKTAIEKHTK